MSLQLERRSVDFGGARYEICCNMAALDELQDRHGGSMDDVFKSPAQTITAELMLIMLNRARRKLGEEPVTREDLGEEYSYAMMEDLDIFGMFIRSMSAGAARKKTAEGAEKN